MDRQYRATSSQVWRRLHALFMFVQFLCVRCSGRCFSCGALAFLRHISSPPAHLLFQFAGVAAGLVLTVYGAARWICYFRASTAHASEAKKKPTTVSSFLVPSMTLLGGWRGGRGRGAICAFVLGVYMYSYCYKY